MTDKRRFTIVEKTDAPADIMLEQLHAYFTGLAARIEALADPQYARVIIEKDEFDMKAEVQFPVLSPSFPSDGDEACSFFWVSASAENPMKLAVTIIRTDEDESYAQKVERSRAAKDGLRGVIDHAFGMRVPVPMMDVNEADDSVRANEIKIEGLNSILDITSMVDVYIKREIKRAQDMAAGLQKLSALKL